jgi:hypothetical protein
MEPCGRPKPVLTYGHLGRLGGTRLARGTDGAALLPLRPNRRERMTTSQRMSARKIIPTLLARFYFQNFLPTFCAQLSGCVFRSPAANLMSRTMMYFMTDDMVRGVFSSSANG